MSGKAGALFQRIEYWSVPDVKGYDMNIQKLTMSLLFVQMVVLIWLAIKLASLEQSVAQLSPDITVPDNNIIAEQAVPVPVSSIPDTSLSPGQGTLDAAQVQAIIRTELERFDFQDQSQTQLAQSVDTRPAPIADPRNVANLKSIVDGQLDLFTSGVVPTHGEIAQLEQNIARLPAAERAKALQRMVRAINQGDLKIRF